MKRKAESKLYYSISEAATMTAVKPHVLRYWETQFEILHPKKNRAGNRVYRPKEVQTVLLVKRLLYEEKFTIEGARRRIKDLRKDKQLDSARSEALSPELILGIRRDLGDLMDTLDLRNDAWDEGIEA